MLYMRTFDSAIWRILSQQCRQLLFVIRQMAEPKVHATDTLFKTLYLAVIQFLVRNKKAK